MSDDRETVIKIMRGARIATLAYQDAQGRLVSTPMGVQDFDDPSTTWFLTRLDSDKVEAIERNPEVNVAYASDDGWVSLSGVARVNADRAKIEELWDPSASAFMSGGPENPENGLLEIDAHSAQLWESPGKIGMLVTMAKGIAGGDPAKDSDAPIVDL